MRKIDKNKIDHNEIQNETLKVLKWRVRSFEPIAQSPQPINATSEYFT